MIPKLKTVITNNSITFTDITGRYDVTNNPNGWGTPNIDYVDIVESKVTVTNLTTNNTVVFLIPINGTLTTPEEIEFDPFEYAYEDGTIKIEYYLKDINEVEYLYCSKVFYMLNINCCIDTLLFNTINNEEDTVYLNKVLQAEAIRAALCKSALCMNAERITYFFNKLKLICNSCATVT